MVRLGLRGALVRRVRGVGPDRPQPARDDRGGRAAAAARRARAGRGVARRAGADGPAVRRRASDPGADADFAAAQARFERATVRGRARSEAFVTHHPQHPARPAAELMLARLALLRGDVDGAAKLLEPLAETPPEVGVASSARYYLGLADARLGKFARARELLMPFLPRAGSAGPGDEALVELRGALAEATAGVGDLRAALALWEAYDRGGATPREGLRAPQGDGARRGDPARGAPRRPTRRRPTRASRARCSGPRRRVPARAGRRLGRGDRRGRDGGRRAARSGSRRRAARGGAGDPARLGLAVPLTGKFQPVGEAAMRAAMLATGAPACGARGSAARRARHGADGEHAGRAVSELTRDESVIGVARRGRAQGRRGHGQGGRAGGAPAAVARRRRAGRGRRRRSSSSTRPRRASRSWRGARSRRARATSRCSAPTAPRASACATPSARPSRPAAGASRRRRPTCRARRRSGAIAVDQEDAAAGRLRRRRRRPARAHRAGARLRRPVAGAVGQAPPAAAPGKPRGATSCCSRRRTISRRACCRTPAATCRARCSRPGSTPTPPTPRAQAFVDAYRAAYGQEPHATEAYAYDGVNALRAAAAAGGRTRADVAARARDGLVRGADGRRCASAPSTAASTRRASTRSTATQIRLAR